MADQTTSGFLEFRQTALRSLEPLLAAARSFLQTGEEMIEVPVSAQFPDLAFVYSMLIEKIRSLVGADADAATSISWCPLAVDARYGES